MLVLNLLFAIGALAAEGGAEQRYTFELDGSKETSSAGEAQAAPGKAKGGDHYEVFIGSRARAAKAAVKETKVQLQATESIRLARMPVVESVVVWRDDVKGTAAPVEGEVAVRFFNPSEEARTFSVETFEAVTDVNRHLMKARLGPKGQPEWDGALDGRSNRLVVLPINFYDDGGWKADIRMKFADSAGYSYTVWSGPQRIRKGDPKKDVHRTREMWKDERLPY